MLAAVVRLTPPSVLVLGCLLSSVVTNPSDESNRRDLVGLARLGMDLGTNVTAALAMSAVFLFVLALSGVGWAMWLAADVVATVAADDGLARAYAGGELANKVLAGVEVVVALAVVVTALTVVVVVRDDRFSPLWTMYVLIVAGLLQFAAAQESRKLLP